MKKTNKTMKRVVAGCLLVGILASVGIGAYLTDTDVKQDVYTVGNVQAEIVSSGDMEVANVGALLPGTVHTYERAATNTGINDAYVFMSITIPYEMVGVADDSGAQLGEKVMQLFIPGTINSEWKLVDDGFIGEYEIEANGQLCGEHDTHSVALGNTITYVYGYIGDNADGSLKALASGETTSNLIETMKLTNLYNASKIDGEVSTKLYAIQDTYVNGGLTDVNGVWAVINNALVGEQVIANHTMIDGVEFNAYIPEKATSVEFIAMPQTYGLSDRTAPADAVDVSVARDGSIMAWLEDTTFYVVAMDGGKIIEPDASKMFYCKDNLTFVNFENLIIDAIGDSTFHGCNGLTTIALPDGITSIGQNTFYCCENLTEISIPTGVTTIGEYAFISCSKLASINIPEGVEHIGIGAFYACKSLTSIELPDSVTIISDNTFKNCTNLAEITIHSNTTSIGEGAFLNCTKLKTINYTGTEEQWNAIEFGFEWNRSVPTDCVINFNYVPEN